jgi:hypothetical protein
MLATAGNISGDIPVGNISGTISASALDDGSSIDGGTY